MKIVNVQAKSIEACCSFDYKGFEISISTIFRPGSIAVFENIKTHIGDFPTVEAALAHVDAIDAGRRMEAAAAAREDKTPACTQRGCTVTDGEPCSFDLCPRLRGTASEPYQDEMQNES